MKARKKSALVIQVQTHMPVFSLNSNTGLFKMIVWILTTCHTQYTSDSSM